MVLQGMAEAHQAWQALLGLIPTGSLLAALLLVETPQGGGGRFGEARRGGCTAAIGKERNKSSSKYSYCSKRVNIFIN